MTLTGTGTAGTAGQSTDTMGTTRGITRRIPGTTANIMRLTRAITGVTTAISTTGITIGTSRTAA